MDKQYQRKGKGVASSSSQPKKKKRQMVLQDEESDEERQPQQEEEEMDLDDEGSPERPEWKVGTSLHTLPPEWQMLLFKEKMGEADSMKKQLIGERKTNLDEFRGFDFVECFERMGWTQGLVWNNRDSSEVYLEGIIEWLGTLERTLGNNPPETIKLTGMVNRKKVVMSFATLDKIAKFDVGVGPFNYLRDEVLTGSDKGDNWFEMISHLFTFTPEQINMNAKLERYYLKPLPRLMMSILLFNVCPRPSDRAMVRFNDVIILYALTTGNLKLSLRQIIMSNIWDARNKRNKTILPHPRLITSLIKLHRAIPREAIMVDLPQIPFSIDRLASRGQEWKFEDTPPCPIVERC